MTLRLFSLPAVPAVLSITAGYIDTAGFLALHGLFTSHVTGNFVTIGASLAYGTSGAIAKILALPVFCVVVFATRILRFRLERSGLPVLGVWLALQFVLLTIAAALALHYGPFPDANTVPAVATGLTLVVAMAIQNAFHRIHLSSFPPSTIMTGTTTQAMLDLADLVYGVPADAKPGLTARLSALLDSILAFAIGCAISAVIYTHFGEWVFAVAPLLGAITIALYFWEKRLEPAA
ncbi:MAG: YoaK family protein [Hyphomicrobium sp.]